MAGGPCRIGGAESREPHKGRLRSNEPGTEKLSFRRSTRDGELLELEDMQTDRAMVAGMRMRWEVAGPPDGQPIVLIHGFPTSPSVWRHVAPLLDGARCLAWEMVGYGDSIPEGHLLDLSVAAQAGYVLSWMKEVEVSRPLLVGHDIGGGVAQIVAAREKCAGLVLVDSVAYDNWPTPPIRSMRRMGGSFQRLPNRPVRRLFGRLIRKGHDDRTMARESIDVHWRPYGERDAAEVLSRQIRGFRSRDTLEVPGVLQRLRVPTWVVWGSKDPYLDRVTATRLAGDLGAPLRLVNGARHFLPEDHPDDVARAISEAMTELRRA